MVPRGKPPGCPAPVDRPPDQGAGQTLGPTPVRGWKGAPSAAVGGPAEFPLPVQPCSRRKAVKIEAQITVSGDHEGHAAGPSRPRRWGERRSFVSEPLPPVPSGPVPSVAATTSGTGRLVSSGNAYVVARRRAWLGGASALWRPGTKQIAAVKRNWWPRAGIGVHLLVAERVILAQAQARPRLEQADCGRSCAWVWEHVPRTASAGPRRSRAAVPLGWRILVPGRPSAG